MIRWHKENRNIWIFGQLDILREGGFRRIYDWSGYGDVLSSMAIGHKT